MGKSIKMDLINSQAKSAIVKEMKNKGFGLEKLTKEEISKLRPKGYPKVEFAF